MAPCLLDPPMVPLSSTNVTSALQRSPPCRMLRSIGSTATCYEISLPLVVLVYLAFSPNILYYVSLSLGVCPLLRFKVSDVCRTQELVFVPCTVSLCSGRVVSVGLAVERSTL